MSELYSPVYLVDHLARRASCPPDTVWLILLELFPWITRVTCGPDPTGYALTSADAAQVEKHLWAYLDDELVRENEPSIQPRPRPIGQRVFTSALAATIPQNYSLHLCKLQTAQDCTS